ncbi:MAG: WecB/TagA/CpsF family glycosyltransferase [Actinomycetota bacterium]
MDEQSAAIRILGVPIACLDRAGALREIERLGRLGGPSLIAYANAHTLNLAHRDEQYRALLASASLLLNDGAGVALAARIMGSSFVANLNGSDFNPEILRLAARNGWPVYLLGAAPGVAERAGAILAGRIDGLQLAGTHDGYFDARRNDEIAAEVRASGAEVLMVAMGNPVQETWLARHLVATGVRVGVGVGAFLDFTVGVVPRAPAWMNKLGVEWLYRLGQEPRRMWRRYLIGNPLFVMRVLRRRLSTGVAGKLGS